MSMLHIRARLTAKKFNIWTEEIDPERKSDSFMSGDWIAEDGKLYYGHPLFVFFESNQNSWWKGGQLFGNSEQLKLTPKPEKI